MNTNDEAVTAVDVIRCVYLARMARQMGHDEAARRWQAKAERWLQAHPRLARPKSTETTAAGPGNEDECACNPILLNQ